MMRRVLFQMEWAMTLERRCWSPHHPSAPDRWVSVSVAGQTAHEIARQTAHGHNVCASVETFHIAEKRCLGHCWGEASQLPSAVYLIHGSTQLHRWSVHSQRSVSTFIKMECAHTWVCEHFHTDKSVPTHTGMWALTQMECAHTQVCEHFYTDRVCIHTQVCEHTHLWCGSIAVIVFLLYLPVG